MEEGVPCVVDQRSSDLCPGGGLVSIGRGNYILIVGVCS